MGLAYSVGARSRLTDRRKRKEKARNTVIAGKDVMGPKG